MLLVGEAGEAHGGLAGAAAPPRPGDGVADAAVRQPARVAAVVAQQLPGGEHLAHLGQARAVLEAGLRRLVVGQLAGVDQVVEAACGEGTGQGSVGCATGTREPRTRVAFRAERHLERLGGRPILHQRQCP